ncbi:unnamed protein product [[Candida] boidinii]|uniref:Unnamed protein product n=1 Tax=Candida boidinii TaxID=5477 RepID=A0A9W6WF70_CANBO|nr:hypothetical protein B5S30_g3674 [[Candida] boidinii]OWB83694.1 hypothetical protein B5S33_g2325 [[Candida] boidinii]GME66993.1 unnamed protein product [[Candida] boidinii]GMF99619.1 unnamed protein product [[Candida] boidinii]
MFPDECLDTSGMQLINSNNNNILKYNISVNKSIYDLSELTLDDADEKKYEHFLKWEFKLSVRDQMKKIKPIGVNPTIREFRVFDAHFIRLIDNHFMLDFSERLQSTPTKYPPLVEEFIFSTIGWLVPMDCIGTYFEEGKQGIVSAYNAYRKTALNFPYTTSRLYSMFYKVRLNGSKEFAEYREEIRDILYISSMPNSPRVPNEMIIDILYTNINHLGDWKREVYREYQRNKDHIHSPSQTFKSLNEFLVEVGEAHDCYLSLRRNKTKNNRKSRKRKAITSGKPSKSASVSVINARQR